MSDSRCAGCGHGSGVDFDFGHRPPDDFCLSPGNNPDGFCTCRGYVAPKVEPTAVMELDTLHAENERLRGLLYEELFHDHDCQGHDGRDPEYDAGWLLFYRSYEIEDWIREYNDRRARKERTP